MTDTGLLITASIVLYSYGHPIGATVALAIGLVCAMGSK